MKINRKILISSLVAFVSIMTGFSHITCAQADKERFDKLVIGENFDSISGVWMTMSNAENLFIVQEGEYILQRKASTAPFAILANFETDFSNYKVVTSIKLDKNMGENPTCGLLFMMQPEGQGGFLFECNRKKEYRIRQIVGGVYRYITGSSKDGGWVKNNAINEGGIANIIEVRCAGRSYDLSANGTLLKTFSEPSYQKGKFGLIIGPESRARVDFMYVFTRPEPADLAVNYESGNPGSSGNASQSPDIIELAESIIKLKTRINTLEEEKNDLQKIIAAMKSGDQERDVTAKNFEKQIKSLQDQVRARDNSIDSLKKVNNDLLKYKELIGNNDNGDVIINLSKALKAEKEKNQKLESDLNELREKYGIGKTNSPK